MLLDAFQGVWLSPRMSPFSSPFRVLVMSLITEHANPNHQRILDLIHLCIPIQLYRQLEHCYSYVYIVSINNYTINYKYDMINHEAL